jgi:hypothetical protein
MKIEMVFETSVSTKAEPHYPAENPKELLHENWIKGFEPHSGAQLHDLDILCCIMWVRDVISESV